MANSPDEPVNHRELDGGHDGDERPHEKFAEAQTALPGGGKPELQFRGAKCDDVAVAEGLILKRLAIEGDQGVRRNRKIESSCLKFEREVLIPDTTIIQLQVIARSTSDAKRKTADNRLAARLFS